MLSDKYTIQGITWKRINMRNITHLMGVEFLHDLYNRHVQRINFIRFRNTVTLWKDGIANSYAPERDFELLEKYFGEKFYILDQTTIREFGLLLDSTRDFFNEQMMRFEDANLSELTNAQLGLLLIDIQQYSLGELYQMNFVQAEYSLTAAIKRILKEVLQDDVTVNEVFSQIIATDIPTESQKEELEFLTIAQIHKQRNGETDEKIRGFVQNHFEKFAYMHCAYGEDPYEHAYYEKKLQDLNTTTQQFTTEEIKNTIKNSYDVGREKLKELQNTKLDILVPLMIKGGTFRDKNKASLGYTIKYKHNLFNEISRRNLEQRNALNFYLLSEILELLDSQSKVPVEILQKRKNNGVTLVRSEYLDTITDFSVMDLTLPNQKDAPQGASTLRGRCACSGEVQGVAKIIYTKKDSVKICRGDILIAVGTDFDLMDAIQRSAGVVTEEGGLLSHAAVVCREMRKPCIINVHNATSLIKDGDILVLDSKNGVITILEKS